MKRILMLVGLVVILGCSKEAPMKNQKVIGLEVEGIVSVLGDPKSDSTLEIKKGDKLPEYQSSLMSVLPATGSLSVRELTWKDEKKTTKVWMKKVGDKWKSFDSLEWSKNVRMER